MPENAKRYINKIGLDDRSECVTYGDNESYR